ncbi:hypothetical protein [Sphingobacterium wenxiniae]|uniref:Uncharacterized protein n=1 Tax=Sphingobacterium wenxiniae TaxID=683125 RepID=A0A1I6V330_9SPHI|nr:hypothetical protein [Sphingobacterium wenxiniae]SFT08130.1 hypothetical protein SAMN05660206_11139 [Sphingobacterium wenxiniae]
MLIKHKYIIISTLSIIISTLYLSISDAQIIENDQPHFRIKWKQINEQNFQLIFPDVYENTALKLADILEVYIQQNSKHFHKKPRKITLILQGNHLSQNGYVQLAPRKSELYPVPSSTADNQEWLPNLALHELRHVAQFDKLTGKIKGPFFEQLALALYGLNLPAWYFEGDAVQSETMFSEGGRGRLPSWEMPIRANILSGRNYGFNKYVLGSFKDNVPSYYTIGYLMNTYLTNHLGYQSHEKIMEDMRGKLLRPYNFQRALKQVSGLRSKDLFHVTMKEVTEKWELEKPIPNKSNTIIPTKQSRYPNDYLLPQSDNNGQLFALKQSPAQVSTIVTVDPNGKEKNIVKTGLQITPYFHLRDTEIVWDEFRKDARFGKQTYNVINIYNTATGALKTLTRNTRYYSPTLHPHEPKIALIEVGQDNKSRLLTINAHNGQLIDSILPPTETHIQQPRYNENGDRVIAIAVNREGTNLIEFDLIKRTHRLLLPWSNQQLERPQYRQNNIFFKAHYNGIDNIYQLDTKGKIQQLTDAIFGAFNPFVSQEEKLIYNDYHHNGYKIAETDLSPITPGSSAAREFYITNTLKQLQQTETYTDTTTLHKIESYNPSAHLFNFHSLSISSTNFESFDNYKPGLFWLSNDLLNTTQVKLGYEYDTDIDKSSYSAEISYRRYFPVLTTKYINRGLVGNAVGSDDKIVMYDFREHLATFDIALPFSVYRQNTVYSYGFNMGTSYTRRYDVSLNLKNFKETIAFPLNYQLYFNRNAMRSRMDILPRWGQNFSVTYRHLPFEKDLTGYILSARTNFYFPGLASNHSLQARFAIQKNEGRYQNSYDIPLVSGWGHFLSPIVRNTAMLNYRLPLFYPDWSIGSLAYIKRFQGLLFSDFQNVHHELEPKSFGIGISADFNILRYTLPDINAGTKLIYINDRTASQKIVPTFSLSYTY